MLATSVYYIANASERRTYMLSSNCKLVILLTHRFELLHEIIRIQTKIAFLSFCCCLFCFFNTTLPFPPSAPFAPSTFGSSDRFHRYDPRKETSPRSSQCCGCGGSRAVSHRRTGCMGRDTCESKKEKKKEEKQKHW